MLKKNNKETLPLSNIKDSNTVWYWCWTEQVNKTEQELQKQSQLHWDCVEYYDNR